ncbi:iron-containing alcohol dehydrogenase [Pelagibius litoralis]|uniref:Iron-containing alcohol dehydrogenase n=1 Tax=Pelagibius litoralis TaxID=374515 RepID=A0A967C2W8_9PROT|nr:iron-containing alcohol dehydrogenase [Pelagibius litoralis]NIA67390.1 iron-containing alcohol dehydrogenase [Pelagibius litoralis]
MTVLAEIADPEKAASFSLNAVPEIHFGAGRAQGLAADIKAISKGRRVLLVADAALVDLGIVAPLRRDLEAAGAVTDLFADIAGEPKASQIDAAAEAARLLHADALVCIGGGSALDIGKLTSCIAGDQADAMAYALGARPLPAAGLPKICIPTTAGTGSELSATNIFSNNAGKKVWIWGQETKPDRVLLDPLLTLSLPPHLTAWTGLDALVHALEACTSNRAHAGNTPICHQALRLIAGALAEAVEQPGSVEARGAMLLGSAYAGIGIDNCGTAMAHNISHALAALAPVHHGLATALALEVTLSWSVEDGAEASQQAFAAAAQSCGLAAAAELPDWFSTLMSRCGVERRLPAAFADYAAADLAREMRREENQPMRTATARAVGEDDIDRFAAATIALA